MDFMTIIIILAVLISIISGILWYVFIFFIGRTIVKGIAKNFNDFQRMDVNGMYQTLVHLQQTGQFQLGQQYMGSLEGPITSEIRGMAASEGISLNF